MRVPDKQQVMNNNGISCFENVYDKSE